MKQETIKIQVLNDTKLCVLPVLPDLKTIVPIDSIDNLTVSWGIHGHETAQAAITKENGYIVLPIVNTMPLGIYDVHMRGTINGQQWSDNRYAMFELVKYGNGIRYDQYYTTTVILGLPDEVLAQLKEEYAQKIAEYQRLIDELNRGEVATKSDLGLLPGETVAGLIKAGGGGGGGLTPEQYDALAKRGANPDMDLTLIGNFLVEFIGIDRQKSVQDKLDTIIANTSLTAAQADEDWQNVQPITE